MLSESNYTLCQHFHILGWSNFFQYGLLWLLSWSLLPISMLSKVRMLPLCLLSKISMLPLCIPLCTLLVVIVSLFSSTTVHGFLVHHVERHVVGHGILIVITGFILVHRKQKNVLHKICHHIWKHLRNLMNIKRTW